MHKDCGHLCKAVCHSAVWIKIENPKQPAGNFHTELNLMLIDVCAERVENNIVFEIGNNLPTPIVTWNISGGH